MVTLDLTTHTYTNEAGLVYPSVTQILKVVRIVDDSWYTEESRLRGQYVHEATAMFDRGELDEAALDPVLRPYVEAWTRFKESSGFQANHVEFVVYRNDLRFAGTLDRYGTIASGESWLLDIKSGKPEPWTGLQLAGYGLCLDLKAPRFAVELRPDGNFHVTPYNDRNDYAVFMAALAVYHWRKNHEH